MSKSIITKVAAFACSVAAMGALSIAAAAQNPVPADTDVESMSGLTAGKTNIIAGTIEAEAGETVKFPVYIANNSEDGYAATGLRLFYDSRLEPVTNEKGALSTKKGEAGNDITPKFTLNKDKTIIGVGTMGSDPEYDNGIMYTVEIKVPADAAPGTEYPMTLEVDKWLDANTDPIDYVLVNGKIFIKEGPVTTPAPVTTTSAPATTTTSAPATEPTTTPAPTTTAAPVTDPTTTTVASATTAANGSTTAADATTKKGGVVVTTTAKPGNNPNSGSTTATKTGDAGVGLAVAGLMLAAGAAVVTKKKKD